MQQAETAAHAGPMTIEAARRARLEAHAMPFRLGSIGVLLWAASVVLGMVEAQDVRAGGLGGIACAASAVWLWVRWQDFVQRDRLAHPGG